MPFSPAHPDHRAVNLKTLAYSLAGINRYGSHARPRISVAEHAVFVSRKLGRMDASLSLQMAGLHHDDAEALNGIGDVQRPAKPLLDESFRDRERKLDQCVWRALAWPDKEFEPLWQTAQLRDPLLKAVDCFTCVLEARFCMPSAGEGWEQTFGDAAEVEIPTDRFDVLPFWPDWQAEREYLKRHHELAERSFAEMRVAA
jgi:hypothetical protein